MALFGKKEDKVKPAKAPKADAELDMLKEPEDHKHDHDAKDSSKAKTVKSKEDTADAYRILTKPIVSEKTYRNAGLGKYVFKVNRSANKISVRKAVEKVYDVKVAKVNIVNVYGKAKRSGAVSGRTQNWKKAVVTLKAGQSIEGA